MNQRRSSSKTLLIVVIVLLVAIICIGGVFVYNTLSKDSTPTQSQESTFTYDENAGAKVEQTQTQTQVKPGVAIPGWGSITIPAGQTNVYVDFYNPEKNTGYYDMTFKLSLADGTVLYQSGGVRPGQHINEIVLSEPLDAGTYDAILFVQPYTADDSHTPTNNANVKLKLIVT